LQEVATLNPLFKENAQFFGMPFDSNDPYRLVDSGLKVEQGEEDDEGSAAKEAGDKQDSIGRIRALLGVVPVLNPVCQML
jgi:hypothetical protein